MRFLLLISIFLIGCAGKTTTEYIPVEVPIHCEIEAPEKPILQDIDITLKIMDILEYARKLEIALRACRGDL
jgi:hypothetical protein